MPGRRKSRQKALQILFLWDIRRYPVDEAIATYYAELYSAELEEETGDDVDSRPAVEPFMELLVRGTAANVETLDELISQRAENWRLARMPVVDRNILRMAVYEMKFHETPPAVVIDEALELARRYSEEEAIPFINGVLDGIRKAIAS